MNKTTQQSVDEIKQQLQDNDLSDGEYVLIIHKIVHNKGRIAVTAFQNFNDFEENVQRVSDQIIADDPDNGIYFEWITYE